MFALYVVVFHFHVVFSTRCCVTCGFTGQTPPQPHILKDKLYIPNTFKVFPSSWGFQNTVKSGVSGYDFMILIAFKCKAFPSHIPIFRLLSLRINFPLMNWRLAMTSGVRISASESPHITCWFSCIFSQWWARAVSAVAMGMCFPSDARRQRGRMQPQQLCCSTARPVPGI